MDTKWKTWTYRPLTKLLAFLVAVICLFSGLYTILFYQVKLAEMTRPAGYQRDYYYISSYNPNQADFAAEKLYNLLTAAQTVALYGSEEQIRSREHLTEDMEYYYTSGGERMVFSSLNNQSYYVDPEDTTYSAVVSSQLEDFHRALGQLKSSGVDYYISTGSDRYQSGNRKHPYSFVVQDHVAQWKNESGEEGYHFSEHRATSVPLHSSEDTIYLGTDAEEYAQVMAFREEMQWQNKEASLILVLIGVIGFIAVVILTLGAGRTVSHPEEIQFFPLEKIYLDVMLGLIFVLFGFAAVGGQIYKDLYLYTKQQPSIAIFTTIAIVVVVLPLFLFYLSFVKRVKQGKWWRHTLVYRGAQWALKKGKELWTLFCQLPSLSILIVILFVGGMGMLLILGAPGFVIPTAMIVAAGVIFHFHSLGILRNSATEIENGNLGHQVPIKYGLLEPVARSLENISEGMDEAVAKQMKSERLKTDLITNVSHDIRTPLTSLITYTDLLKTQGLDSPDAEKYLDILIQKSHRLKQLTDDLFEATKATSGNITVSTETLDLSQLINQYLGEVDQRIKESQLELIPNIPPHAYILADGRLLWRVLENLFSNLFKYAMKGSRVYLDVSQVDHVICMELKNISQLPLNISSEDLTQRFTRGDDSRSTEGSGLGLSIVESFIHAQKGTFEITVDGDLFKTTICLPATSKPLFPIPADPLPPVSDNTESTD